MLWEVAGVWDHSVSGTTPSPLPFTGLAGAEELLVIMDGVGKSVSGVAAVRLSTDNGATYFNTSGDYLTIPTTGVGVTVDAMALHMTAATAARTGALHIQATSLANRKTTPTHAARRHQFRGSLDPITALQVVALGGGDFNSGVVWVLKRIPGGGSGPGAGGPKRWVINT